MLTFISCAKTMTTKPLPAYADIQTEPRFAAEAQQLALYLGAQSVDWLMQAMNINTKIATENFHRFQNFHSEDTPQAAALSAYTGIVFKHLNAKDFTVEELNYAQKHLRITSFLYGLLRPLDAIKAYRLEGDVRLPSLDTDIFHFWQSRLTDIFLSDIKACNNVLCNLASDEMRRLFNWKRIVSEVSQIITPEFYVYKDDKPRTIVIYTKMARGAMTRFILKNKITHLEDLKAFEWEGFSYDKAMSHDDRLVFTLR